MIVKNISAELFSAEAHCVAFMVTYRVRVSAV